MDEIVTEAVILSSRSRADGSRQVNLFTKELGRVVAGAKGGMKMLSKLSPHLDSLNLSEVRLKNHNRYIITDALTKDRFRKLRREPALLERALEISSVTNLAAPLDLKDLELWYYLVGGLRKSKFSGEMFLKILGYDPMLATCSFCRRRKVSYFLPLEQLFICKKCSEKVADSKLFRI